jgi:hypothetical protein
MRTAIEHAQEFFQTALASGQEAVANTAIHDYVGEKTGQSRAVLHGTLDGTGGGSLSEADWYLRSWRKDNKGGRLIHRQRTQATDPIIQRELEYDCPVKRTAYRKIMEQFLPAEGTPRMLTLAGATGICVQAALQRNPATIIENIEFKEDVLRAWQARKSLLGATTEDRLCRLEEFVTRFSYRSKHYALVNIDTAGYAAKLMYSYLTAIKEAHNATILVLTAQVLEDFRNHGTFQDELRAKYANETDRHALCISDWLAPDYEMVERYGYQNGFHTDAFVFQLTPASMA